MTISTSQYAPRTHFSQSTVTLPPNSLTLAGCFDFLDHLLFLLFEEADVEEVFVVGCYYPKRISSHCIKKAEENNRKDQIKYLYSEDLCPREVLLEHWDTIFKDDIEDVIIIPINICMNINDDKNYFSELLNFHKLKNSLITMSVIREKQYKDLEEEPESPEGYKTARKDSTVSETSKRFKNCSNNANGFIFAEEKMVYG